MNINNCLIVGCNGQFGRVFRNKFSEAGIAVSGMDLQEAPIEAGYSVYVQGNIAAPSDTALSLIQKSDLVLLCIPEDSVLEAVPLLIKRVRADSAIVDIASVKSRIDNAVRTSGLSAGYLSIHPMFGPLPSFAGRNVCVVPIRENKVSGEFIELLLKWEARLTTVSAHDHDEIVALTQVLPHVAILSFVATLCRFPRIATLAPQLATPIYTAMLALAARLTSGDPSLYWSIQSENPSGKQVRAAINDAIIQLENAVNRSDAGHLQELFASASKNLGASPQALREIAARIVELAKLP